MKKSNLLLVLFIVFIQYNVQAQSGDVNSAIVANNDVNDLSELQQSEQSNSTSTKALSKKEQKDLEEQKQLEREARLYAAEQALQRKLNFIELNKTSVSSKILTYNASLEACRCGKAITDKSNDDSIEFKALNMREIRAHFIDKNITLAKIYMESLSNCKK